MSTKIVMPQMGESIAEGTITKWLKKVGDAVERDEPLFEISTDKVDSVIPAPASGTLLTIDVQEGQTVEINTTVGMIGAAGESAGAAPAAAAPAAPVPNVPAVAPTAAPDAAPVAQQAPPAESSAPAAGGTTAAVAAPPAPRPASGPVTQKRDETGRVLTSPLVRNIAKAQGVDLAQVPGTGFQNRVTREDVESFLKSGARPAAAAAPAPGVGPSPSAAPYVAPAPGAEGPMPYSHLEHAPTPIPGDVFEPMTHIQKRMAGHMWQAKQLIPHVTTVFEFDLSKVVAVRAKEKKRFEAETGTKLTYMPFYCRAVVEALKLMPLMNCSIHGDQIVYHKTINLGIAVALDWGLIVPVIKNAEEKSFLGLARAVNDLATRARGKQLKPEDIQGGTFTITNPGVFGSLFGTPIISPPQVGILDLGGIQKRPVVVETETGDSIAIRSMQYVATAFDHRILGGAEADKFMNILKDRLENWSESLY